MASQGTFLEKLTKAFRDLDSADKISTKAFAGACGEILPIFDFLGMSSVSRHLCVGVARVYHRELPKLTDWLGLQLPLSCDARALAVQQAGNASCTLCSYLIFHTSGCSAASMPTRSRCTGLDRDQQRTI